LGWEPLAAGLADLTPALSLILPLLLVAFTGFVTWLVARRKGSGKIDTSEAGVLWSASEALRSSLSAQLERAEAQRDRLIETQNATLPLINQSLQNITSSLTRLEGNHERQRGTGSEGPEDRRPGLAGREAGERPQLDRDRHEEDPAGRARQRGHPEADQQRRAQS
jgi:hypothetical protein